MVALSLLGAMVTTVGLVSVLGKPDAAPVAGPLPERALEPAPVRPGSTAPPVQKPVPVPEPQPQDSEGLIGPIREWANKVATAVDIPARALVSYVRADLAMSEYQPDCRISWATLAGIGRVESDHGRYGNRTLGEDAVPSRPIIGVALDGGPNVRAISDTDNGALDGDPIHDRAVGPMQFIPTTWSKWATDGNGDGVGNPQNLDDAATAAARYLCAGGRDMSSGQGWWSGVMSYNNSVEYARKVYALAETYAAASNRRE
ncbi:lytic transglycosylase domain-containing protein [Haloactinomyces albus]|uniref:Membrane-bound lytic murein transglycosylase B n=1 Tax=Haloactinomyces albus TaxID=1352928 RepID=A0AAE4CP27_9ACTN|nr:lytic transglycosylase domain-containing protein [Haloactinomyces albus]MDR7302682.1 membrane-bound lytic murein transglycosylase B [Haloactinomyces albus]